MYTCTYNVAGASLWSKLANNTIALTQNTTCLCKILCIQQNDDENSIFFRKFNLSLDTAELKQLDTYMQRMNNKIYA